MVEIEEITDDTKEGAIKADAPKPKTKPPPKGKRVRVPKKDLPSVSYLLAHGSKESQGRPKTFCDIFGYPIFVAICFAISLLTFHYAPHEKSVQPKGKFSMQRQRSQRQQQQYQEVVTDPIEVPIPNTNTEQQQQEEVPLSETENLADQGEQQPSGGTGEAAQDGEL